MLLILILSLLSLLLLFDLLRIRLQLKRWAEEIEETETGSNLRLSLSVRTPSLKRLCRAFNARLSQEQKAYIQQQTAGKDLKYTISCISHDIRTPLTGVSGYVELLNQTTDKEKAAHYIQIIQKRLQDLESLLDELFLYTKLTQEEYVPDLKSVAPYPILCDLLASFYDRIASAGFRLNLHYPQEALTVCGNEDSIRRIFSNLLKNALAYGTDTISIDQKGTSITFSNSLPKGAKIDTDRLFERFYRADAARHSTGSGLGLSIVEHLTRKMGGQVSAYLCENTLHITVSFCPKPLPAIKK
ncbi:sensor histidine kinase [Mediterraneibacter massiliensis]|uniref:sensor histidine kinase n=1 Tax=Mediterraneibacter massiliensis TaxID=1720300 RepID=UPI000E51EB54|nr:HAMP domain-containing sensor histidine kinase [Mediterraneibacter massiliensis]RGT73588.1 sensor histidine kinase [Ruminococcus sp. AF18-22]